MIDSPLDGLGLDVPLLCAPMAGGSSTPELVVAAARAGGLGLLAGGYRTADDLAAQVSTVRATGSPFGVNLFAPNPVPVDPAAYRRYRDAVRSDAERLGVELPDTPREDDDGWRDKVDLLLATPVPLVSFTFAMPDPRVLGALRRAGSVLAQTVTTVDEAAQASAAGVDLLGVQGAAAGGHSATTTPTLPVRNVPLPDLVASITYAVDLPLVAAGGLVDASGVRAALDAGARAVMLGTALLLAPEAGTSGAHRAALTGPDRGDTVITHAFTGRPARAVPNAFVRAHHAEAPFGYPALHHLTSPLRKAAATVGDIERVHLWAGTGYRAVRERPLAATFAACT